MPELLEYKCPSCGGAINFDSSLQKMKCPYCDTEFDMDTLKAFDEGLKTNSPTIWFGKLKRKSMGRRRAFGLNAYVCKILWRRNCC